MVVAGAVACLAIAFRVASPATQSTVEPAVVSILPSTIPPVSTTSADAATPPTTNPPPTLPLSPLAAELPGPVSALPTTEPVVAPVGLSIPAMDLRAPVRDIGVEPDGQLEIPDETEVGWYRLGSSPGRPGATVLAAHVSWNDTTGPFFRLGDLEPGALVDVLLADGTTRTYQVVERAQYPKLGLPAERIWTREGDEVIVLITCGGDFNRSIRRYTDNIVVYAVPVASTP